MSVLTPQAGKKLVSRNGVCGRERKERIKPIRSVSGKPSWLTYYTMSYYCIGSKEYLAR